jgi:4-hydroxy 2-oxovalerate aldolase
MKNVKILDCTLRDGGRIINCAFKDAQIKRIAKNLADANIDIIEMGFLRDARNVKYEGNSTFFTCTEQIEPFIMRQQSELYVAFIDYGMFDFNTLSEYTGNSIDGIRVGFTKKDYSESKDDLIKCIKSVKAKGYKLFIQGVNSLNYSDRELLDVIDMVNDIHPDSFGIVDTYGAMYLDDVQRLYYFVERNLAKDITIDFHSHNNLQLAFSFAQEIVRMSNGVRNVILDATLDGMGKGAGNLNTELIANFLNTKYNYNYNQEKIFDNIDINIIDYSINEHWGYSTSAMMAGIYKSHPNNIIYLLQKYHLTTNDIRNILMLMSESQRQTYDYDFLDNLVFEYRQVKYDDTIDIQKLINRFENQNVLLVAPGKSVHTYNDKIKEFIDDNHPIVVSINFNYEYSEYVFFANVLRFTTNDIKDKAIIITSDIKTERNIDYVVSLHSLCDGKKIISEDSTLLALSLLRKLKVKAITIAGFDGYSNKLSENYFDETMIVSRSNNDYTKLTQEVMNEFERFYKSELNKIRVSFLTPSVYERVTK